MFLPNLISLVKNGKDDFLFSPLPQGDAAVDLFVAEEDACLPNRGACRLLLVPSEISAFPRDFCADAVLSCGMHARDTLSFSSISEREAMLCLTRTFTFHSRLYEPTEVRVPYLPSLSLYRNLTQAFCLFLFDSDT